MDPHLRAQLEACEAIGSFLGERDYITDTYLAQIVIATTARATDTFASITRLVADVSPVQGTMLCRSLFEDMVVVHWLVLHDEDPDFLIRRYLDHLDAMRLNEATLRELHGRPVDPSDVADLAGREQELRDEFGKYAQANWWGVRRDGSKIGLPGLVDELEGAERFDPRFRGEKPVLREMFDKAQKWNNQLLHHTPAGVPIRLNRDDERRPTQVPLPNPITVLGQAYWVYGQLGCLVLVDVAPSEDWRAFSDLFLHGIYNVFAPAAAALDDPA